MSELDVPPWQQPETAPATTEWFDEGPFAAEGRQVEERLGINDHRGVVESSDVEGRGGVDERYEPGKLMWGEDLPGRERYGIGVPYGADQHQAELSDEAAA